MTLIVARTSPGRLMILGDTRLFDNRAKWPHPPEEGCIKIALPSARVAVAFAGVPDFAHGALATLDPKLPIEQIVEHFAAARRACGGATDFLVGFADGRLARIVGADAEWCPAAWIGNGDAFAAYQPLYAEAYEEFSDVPDAFRAQVAMDEAMRRLVDEHAFADVGDFLAGVVLHDSVFDYHLYSESAAERERVLDLATGRWEPDEPEGPATGGFFVAVSSGPPIGDPFGPRALALHFGPANFGWLYRIDDGFPRPVRIAGDADALVEAARAMGIDLHPLARPG
jgi:hypothetical protein